MPKTTKKPKSQTPPGPSPAVKRTADLLKQAADPTRLQTLLILGEQPRNVGQLVGDLEIHSQPAVSHHLALLRAGGLIEPQRIGKTNRYSLTDEGQALTDAVRGLVGKDGAV